MIDRKFFFDYVRANLFDGKLSQSQVEGLTAILDAYEKDYFDLNAAKLAYIFATVHHECDRRFQPIEEYGKGRGRKYGNPDAVTGKTYYGRGFVQLTWKFNYESMSKLTGADLVNKPELALDLTVATKILFEGMIRGSFTGKKLGDYFTDSKTDWRNARRIINGTDKADLIGSYARKFYAAICFVK